MNTPRPHRRQRRPLWPWLLTLPVAGLIYLAAAYGVVAVHADVPGHNPPNGTVPNPGTQEQELANITFPAPYNVFEFVVTCMACHAGTVDQQVGHGGNWAGSNMASAARDPIFRANQIIVNNTVQSITGQDGAGNLCFRCHSPNAWYSGRTDPFKAGAGDGSTLEHSILLSTDDEGILCELCHRSLGAVTMQRPDLDANDPVWNMMAGIADWPHAGQAFPFGPNAGMPYGDATLQLNDGMTYAGKYPGSVKVSWSDLPITGTTYTGQTYGVYPPGWNGPTSPVPAGEPAANPAGQAIAYSPDGSTPLHFEVPVGPPLQANGWPDYQNFAVSLEHPTTDANGFIESSEMCGACHDLSVPVLNHGMPEQRTYTEWKFSDFGQPVDANGQAVDPKAAETRCQDCHMPTLKHEYADDAPVSVNADPVLAGWFPYAKDRNPNGGTAFHKFAGANRDLPSMMKILYPEVDLEVVGAPTGRDTRIFPGMMSSRDLSWDRASRNSEIELRESANLQILGAPAYVNGRWEVRVRVTNNTGHRIPTGYPDGRHMFVTLAVQDAQGNTVYESGYYDQATATLYQDSTKTAAAERALVPVIDETQNAVMIYEKVTGSATPGGGFQYAESQSLLNTTILFDNRIPPAGYDKAAYFAAGTKFIVYDPVTFAPREDTNRYPDGQNWDDITYVFDAPAEAQLTAVAGLFWQTHTRPFMEHLRASDTSTLRPEGPPSPLEPNYPLTPKYLSENVVAAWNNANPADEVADINEIRSLDGTPLNDNWGGVAYAAWLLTGMGTPFQVDRDTTAAAAAPAAPAALTAVPFDPFAIDLNWSAVAGADGYTVWIRYGQSDLTADWDRLAVVYDGTTFRNDGLNVGKTYGYKVQAFNGKGDSAFSAVVTATTGIGLPQFGPMWLQVNRTTVNTVELAWFDQDDNDTYFLLQRQEVLAAGGFGPWVDLPPVPSQTAGGAFGGNVWTDTGPTAADPAVVLKPSTTYNYTIATCNPVGCTIPLNPAVPATTQGPLVAPSVVTVTVVSAFQVNVAWTDLAMNETNYQVTRQPGPLGEPAFTLIATLPANSISFSDLSAQPGATYTYQVRAINPTSVSAYATGGPVTTPAAPPSAPVLSAGVATLNSVPLNWTVAPGGAAVTGFQLQRANGAGPNLTWTTIAPALAAGSASYTATGLTQKSTYSFRLVAQSAVGNSPWSNVVVVVTAGEMPARPEQLQVVRVTKNTVQLRWMDKSANEQGFRIYRSTDGANWTLTGTTGVNGTNFRDSGLTSKTTYWYRVTAYNAQGESEASEVVSALTK